MLKEKNKTSSQVPTKQEGNKSPPEEERGERRQKREEREGQRDVSPFSLQACSTRESTIRGKDPLEIRFLKIRREMRREKTRTRERSPSPRWWSNKLVGFHPLVLCSGDWFYLFLFVSECYYPPMILLLASSSSKTLALASPTRRR